MKHTVTLTALVLMTAITSQQVRAGEKKLKLNPTAIERMSAKEDRELVKALKSTKIAGFKAEKMELQNTFKLLTQRYKAITPKGSSLNVLFKDTKAETKKQLISLDLSSNELPATEIIYYLCMKGGLNYRIDDHVVVLWERQPKEKLNRY